MAQQLFPFPTSTLVFTIIISAAVAATVCAHPTDVGSAQTSPGVAPNGDMPGSAASPKRGYFYPWGGYFSVLGYVGATLKSDVQSDIGIGVGHGMHFELGGQFFECLSFGIEGGITFHKDNKRQDVIVIDNLGYTSSLDSKFVSSYFSVVAGVGTPFWVVKPVKLAFRTEVDFGYTLMKTRQYYADNCSDCPTQKYDLNNGSFFQPAFSLGYGNRSAEGVHLIGLKLAYRRYFEHSDFAHMWMCLWDFRFSMICKR